MATTGAQELLTVIIRAKNEMGGAVREAQGSLQKLNETVSGAAAKAKDMKVAFAAAAGTLYGLGKAMTEFAGFEKRMAYVNTIAHGTTAELKEMTAELRDMAVEIGVDANAAAAALYDIYSNVGETGKNMALLAAAAKAAVAGFVDVSVTGGAITGVMNAMGMSADDVTKILDTQFKTIERGKINYAQLAESSAMFLASARGAGQEYARVMGGFATITKSMQNTARSATALNAMFTRFKDAEFVAQMRDQAGIAVVAGGNYRDYVEVLGELNEKMKTMSDYAKAELIKKLMPGEEAQRALLSIMGNFETFREDVKAVAEESAGAWLDAYDKMDATTAAKMDKLTQRIADMKLTIGEDLAEQSDDFFSVIERGVNLIAQSLLAVTQTIGGTVDVLRAALQYTKTWPLKGANWKEDRAAAGELLNRGRGKFEKAGESFIRSGLVPDSFLAGSAKLLYGEEWKGMNETPEEKRLRREFEKRNKENIAELKRRAGAGIKPVSPGGETGTATATGGDKGESAESVLKKAAELKRRYLETDVRNRIKFLEEERDAVKRLGGDTLGYEMAIAQEKSDIVERQKEKARKFYEGLKGMAERYAAARREIEEETARGTMGRFEFERLEAKTAYEEDLRRAKELSGAEREAAEKLARLRYKAAGSKADTAEADALRAVMEMNADEYEKRRGAVQREAEEKIEMWKDNAAARAEVEKWLTGELDKINEEEKARRFEEAGAYRQYNLAQLQAMLRDYRATQEEKYAVQAEIDARIAADEVSLHDARLMGMRQATAEFMSNSQMMMDYGRETAQTLRQSFSDIFVAGFKGEIKTIGDLWQSLMSRMRDQFLQTVADMMVKKALSGLFTSEKSESGGGGIGGLLGGLGGLFGGIGGLLSGGGGGVASGLSGLGGLFDGALRPVARLAAGGQINRPLLIAAGGGPNDPGGGPELITPLPYVDKLINTALARGGQQGGGGGVHHHYQINVNAMDAASFQQYLAANGGSVMAGFVSRYAPGAVADDIRSGGQMRGLMRRG